MLLTYRYRVKDATAGKRLARMAGSVNQVWNYCGGIEHHRPGALVLVLHGPDLEDGYAIGQHRVDGQRG